MDEVCELAKTGMSGSNVTVIAAVILGVCILLYMLSRKGYVHYRYFMLALMLGATLSIPAIPQTTYAQAANDCVPVQNNNNQPGSAGLLVDDNPMLEPQFAPGDPPIFDGFRSRFPVLSNDNAPQGDPFDVSTLQLVGNHPSPNADGYFLILDPDNENPPGSPGGYGDPGWEYVWGEWSLELTCNVADVLNCTDTDPGPGISPVCISLDRSGCWPTGYVEVYLSASAQPGTYTIPYTVQTEGGVNLAPATITVAFSETPEPPEPSPITARTDILFTGPCYTWNFDPETYGEGYTFSLDLMDGVNIFTTGGGALLPATIDLDPSTPGRQSTITTYAAIPVYYTTFTVNNSGVVTMTTPRSSDPASDIEFLLQFTIEDEDGNQSNVGQFVYVSDVCG